MIFGKDKYISREKLASIFWPESGAKAANTSLRVALYEMRKTLTQNGVGLESDKGFIIERKEGFRIKDDINPLIMPISPALISISIIDSAALKVRLTISV